MDQPQQLQPQPVPVQFATAAAVLTDPATGTQVRCAMLKLNTPTGEHVTFWDASAVQALVDQLTETLEEVSKPIVQLAGAGDLPRIVNGRAVRPTGRTS